MRLSLLLVSVCSLGPAGCAATAAPRRTPSTELAAPHIVHGFAMGTPVTLTLPPQPSCDLAAARAALDEMARLDRLLTTFTHPGWDPGDIMRLNAHAGRGYIDVAPETYEVLHLAQQVAAASGGAFDVTFAALSRLWRFDEDGGAHLPAPRLVERQRRYVNFRKLQLRSDPPGACLAEPGMQVGLGGIGKGYAVDRMVSLLKKRGCGAFLLQAGGELYAAGDQGTQPWEVGIRSPRSAERAAMVKVWPRDAALSTSGDYERSFFVRGRRYHHILDPRTGMPARASQSVTVMAPQAALADALGDALFVLGPESGLQLAKTFCGVEALIVDDIGRRHTSDRWARLCAPSP